MNSGQLLLLLLLISVLISGAFSQTLPEYVNSVPPLDPIITTNRKILRDDDLIYCRSWSFTVEANDANPWKQVPARCGEFVKQYFAGEQYFSDLNFVTDEALGFASKVEIVGDGKDVWIFDIDETLLTNLPYYADHGFGMEKFDDATFNGWVGLSECPVLPASLKLYKELKRLGFKIVLLTGRDESQRNYTVKNLVLAGYEDWERLLLRGPEDHGTTAVTYKSKKRRELEAEGFRIHGNSGDQWSDLYGSPMATRSFKLPNPMYFIS
ncbi:hypothetical protein ACHQM5_028843 [Ranunculus cassubicifolius]